MNVTHAIRGLCAVVLLAGCNAAPTYQEAFDAGNYGEADALLDVKLKGDRDAADSTPLYQMEKAMIAFARGEPLATVSTLEPLKPTLEERYVDTVPEWLGFMPDRLANPSGLDDFVGADYEQLLLYAVLALGEFMGYGTQRDITPHTLQLADKQRRMLEEDNENEDFAQYNPRKKYSRLAIGQFIEGIFHEARGDWDAAKAAFRIAAAWSPDSALMAEAAGRERFAEGDQGVVYVVYLGGKGPSLVDRPFDLDPETEVAVRGLLLILQLATTGFSPQEGVIDQLLQRNTPIPSVEVHDRSVAPITVRIDGASAATQVLLDVNEVAQQQVEANKAMRIAQTVVLRASRQAGTNQVENDILRRGLNLATTSAEKADLRAWEFLPAQFQAARLAVPQGTHRVDLGSLGSTEVAVRSGTVSMVLVWKRTPQWQPVILVDHDSIPGGVGVP